jgi:phospholipid-translocating ATPase
MLEALCLCHDIEIGHLNSFESKYKESSPDELSFIKFCSKLGIVYEGEEKDPVSSVMIRKYSSKKQIFKYKVLQVLEFDSTRKRMSVIVEDMQTNEIILFCKGAETSIFPRCSVGDIQKCKHSINIFARKGWRTLAISFKYLTKEEYTSIEENLTNAINDVLNRDEQLKKAFDVAESNLELIGATAVEDKLQEDVGATLLNLRLAGIKIWVLTGDKIETAINISHSCKHFSDEMIKFKLYGMESGEKIRSKIEIFQKKYSFTFTLPIIRLFSTF